MQKIEFDFLPDLYGKKHIIYHLFPFTFIFSV